MRRFLIDAVIVIILLLIIPLPKKMQDETSMHLDAMLYDVYLINRWNPDKPVYRKDENGELIYDDDTGMIEIEGFGDYTTGTIIKVLGYEIYNSAPEHIFIYE